MSEGPPPYRWLIPGELAGGPHPERQGVLGLTVLRATFEAVLTTFEEPLARRTLEPWGARYLWLRTWEGEAPDLARAIRFLDESIDQGERVLVHCWAGLGRTGTVLAAYLLHRGEVTTAVEARDRVRRDYDPLAVETPAQMAALEAMARKRKK